MFKMVPVHIFILTPDMHIIRKLGIYSNVDLLSKARQL